MTLDARDDLFSTADLEQLRRRGVALEEAYRQVALLSRPVGHLTLDRPCTPGDGIRMAGEDELARWHAQAERAAQAGRCMTFVPASGAATRMFRDLIAALAGDPAASGAATAFVEALPRFAFAEDLAAMLARDGHDLEALRSRGEIHPILRALLEPAGLGYAERAKGLLPFHRYGTERRTAFEEHLVEAAVLMPTTARRTRLHFTVSAAALDDFLVLLERARPRFEAHFGVRYDAEFSAQKPSTDTLALDLEGRPFRAPDGSLLFRPSGHGALLLNLAELDADLALVKNVDNVTTDALKSDTYAWGRALFGCLVETQQVAAALLARLDDPRDLDAIDEAREFARRVLDRDPGPPASAAVPETQRAAAARLLDRPLRVCGMVRNTGEPGGGPFWVRDGQGGTSLQIVETSQVDDTVAAQSDALARSTHFNPVFMALALRDHRGEPFPLDRFVDQDAVMVSRRSHGGRELLTLERPGLWNGAMSGWNTVFVEVPIAVFNPVKTVADLLRPEHQAS